MKITAKCQKCLECIDVCPVQAIKFENNIVKIDQELCLDCGCCAAQCKSDAIEFD